MITLHNEIVEILNEVGKSLNTEQIAELVNERNNYKKRDGSKVTAFQIHGRTKSYDNLFDRNGSAVMLKNHNKKNNVVKRVNTVKENNTTVAVENITKIEYLIKKGFNNIGELENLLNNGLPKLEELNYCGCYAITKPINFQHQFLENKEVIKNGNVIKPWENERLEKKWVENVDVVYFGIAGAKSNRSLRKRLNDLIKHGNGKTTDRGPHKGGEIFWQLKGYGKFSLWILSKENPRMDEKEYLLNFHKLTGKLPFANRQF